jgi:septal ring factor EnvC (AmiA/AmiB activator)
MDCVVTRLGATLLLSAMLAVLAAGCGGSDTSAEEEWAGDICTAVSGWQDQVQQSTDEAREALQSPGSGTLAAIDAEVREITDATDELGDDLRELEPPDTEAGEQAKRELDTFATQLQATATNTKETFDNLPEDAGITELANALEPLIPSIQSLIESASSTFTAVKESGSELEQGFDDADSCERYR